MCTCATLAPQSCPTLAPYPQVRIAQTSTVSARPKGCPAKRRWPETWDSPGHAGDTRRDQGRRRGSGLRVGATPGPSLPFSNSPASGRGPPHRTLATLSSMPVSPQGDHTCGPLSSSSWVSRMAWAKGQLPPPLALRRDSSGGGREQAPRHPILCASATMSLSLGCLPTTRRDPTQPGSRHRKVLTAALGPQPAAYPLKGAVVLSGLGLGVSEVTPSPCSCEGDPLAHTH